MRKLYIRIYIGREDDTVMAMFWAQKIVHGKKTYAEVPRLLKDQVAEILRESGLEELITEG